MWSNVEAFMAITSKEKIALKKVWTTFYRQTSIGYRPGYAIMTNCIRISSAIDGTIIPAWVPHGHQGAYRCRKGYLAQNVMVACDFNMKFTFVLAGWEGSANDARIFKPTLSNPRYQFSFPPLGKYYVLDSGYSNHPLFLAPYRGERYHLPEWTFGMLKNRFPILKNLMSRYSLKSQTDMVVACCVLHNFILTHQEKNATPAQFFEPDYVPQRDANDMSFSFMDRVDPATAGEEEQCTLRERIATALWEDHVNGNR
ncbi:Unknown protein [Striga hermonthica]|uniref:DDE Tnp4 domain-containing protein n=1 Tax=Striga hermonthica TaxID=68872 RepID=A0A9N7MQM3_STRHE|nr:Unknown protein [Striga hermonthica]